MTKPVLLTSARATWARIAIATLLAACAAEGADEDSISVTQQAIGEGETVKDPTLGTDRLDYLPGEVVTLLGTGFTPGETVTITLEETPHVHEHTVLSAVADESGGFANTDYAPQSHDLGTIYVATAVGTTSGRTATTGFSDGPPSNTGTIDRYTVAATSGSLQPLGTRVNQSCDDCTTFITLPFPVQIYDRTYSNAAVSSNGNLQFDSNRADYQNGALASAPFSYTLLPLWADLWTAPGNGAPADVGIYTATSGTTPNRVYRVRWHVSYYGNRAARADFEIVLFENQAVIDFVYGPVSSPSYGTVGTMLDRRRTTEYMRNGSPAPVNDGLRLRFTPSTTSNQTPIASCREAVVCTPEASCSAQASINNGSSDPDGQTTTLTQTPAGPYAVGTTAVTLTITDSAGASASCTSNVIVQDCQAPTVSCPAPATTECTGERSSSFAPAAATAADRCSSVSVTRPPGGIFPLGTTALEYVATDAPGNSASCTSSITVVDSTAPTISCPLPVTAECAGAWTNADAGQATALDVCAGVTVFSNSLGTFELGSSAVTFTALDGAGLAAQCQTTVTIQDTTAPSISCPAAQVAECTAASSAEIALGVATAEEACTTASVVADGLLSRYPLGSTEVSFQATDANGNAARCTTTATVQDTTAPSITCPASRVAECTGAHSASIDLGTASAADACTSADVVAEGLRAAYALGSTTVAFQATDSSGNFARCESTATVVDTTPPRITCPSPAVAECTGLAGADVDPGTATAADICGGASVNGALRGTYALGITSTEFRAVDEAGLASSCASAVTVIDTTAPLIECPAPVTIECVSDRAATVDLAAATVTDACSISSSNDPAAAAYRLGTSNVDFATTDPSGNTNACNTTVTVIDTTRPVFTNVPAAIQVESEGALTTVAVPLPLATDGCEGALVVDSDAPGAYAVGTWTVTFQTRDSSDNVAFANTTVTVVDTRPPEFSNVPAPVVLEQAGPSGTAHTVPLPTAIDVNDGAVPVTSDAPAVFAPGTTTVTFTATDRAGNQLTTTTTVTVVDTRPPTITTATVNPSMLWPPDHRMVSVLASLAATDVADPSPTCEVTSISSNEPQNGLGDGDTANDWVQTGLKAVSLRAERSGKGSGRVYTLVARCTDSSGNEATTKLLVTVPKNQR